MAELASRQHGYIARRQLLGLGVSSEAIKWRVKTGRLIPVYRGVYAVGHEPRLPMDRAYGALLACGPKAVLSHGTAATVWGIETVWRTPFEVTVPGRVRRPGIRTYASPLAREDVRTSRGLRVTSPERTLLDQAPRLDEAQLVRAADDLRHAGYLRLERLGEVAGRYPRHPGARALRVLVEAPRGPTRSRFEQEFVSWIERFGLPEPLINHSVAGYEVDALWPLERVVVELDGWEWHSSRTSFRNDRRRDTELAALGYVIVRITWERLRDEPQHEAELLGQILAQRARRGS